MNQTYCPVCSAIVNRPSPDSEHNCPYFNVKTLPEEDANEHDEKDR